MAHEGGEGGGGVLRELLALFHFDVDEKKHKEVESKFEEFGKKIKEVAEGVVAALAIEEVYEWAEANVKAMSEVEHTASRLGISTEKVQEFQYASKALGLESESLLNMMGRLQVTQQAAANGTGAAAQAFAKLGVKVKDSNGQFKSADELFLDVADGISKTGDASKAAAVVTQLFGRQGRELLPFLKEGRAGAEKLAAEFRKLGGGWSEKAIEQSKEFEHQSAKLSLAFKGVKSTIMSALLPPLTWLIEKFGAAVGWIKQITEGSHVFEVALIGLAAAALYFAAPMLAAAAPVIALGAALAGVVLLIDDFVGMLEGKDSVIGRSIDKIFGKDAHVEVVRDIKDAWSDVKDVMEGLWKVLKNVWDAYRWILDHAQDLSGWIGDNAAKGMNKIKETLGIKSEGVATNDVNAFSPAWKKAKARQADAVNAFGSTFAAEHHAVIRHGAMQIFGSGADTKHEVAVTINPSPEFHATVDHRIKEHKKSDNRVAYRTLPRGTAQ